MIKEDKTTNWQTKQTTHHHVIGFRDINFKMKLSTLVVTLIWNKKTYHNISIKKWIKSHEEYVQDTVTVKSCHCFDPFCASSWAHRPPW